ncbi:MAG: RluA family pseudouridine synthase [Weeksellaceae bacterium]|nr:RluA family pseudouridine synthase [Weeksellaceae bacterium]
MFDPKNIFHSLPTDDVAKDFQKFTYPFNYQPHRSVELAGEELMKYLDSTADIEYAFGHDDASVGKMFGILVVEDENQRVGYIAAFSGKINEENQLPGFVPPVFDILPADGFFRKGENEINKLTEEIDKLEDSSELREYKIAVENLRIVMKDDLEDLKKKQKKLKDSRSWTRAHISRTSYIYPRGFYESLADESKEQSMIFRRQRNAWRDRIKEVENEIAKHIEVINQLKKQRAEKSTNLQHRLHQSFEFSNALGEKQSLLDIFKNLSKTPPAGAGECAAPRLLQYAYDNNYKPLAMGEFWYGKETTGQIRKHGNYYPACKSKCEPILSFMLQGLKVEDNPAEQFNTDFELKILYEDAYVIAVNKPHDLLSVPGRKTDYCLQNILRKQCYNDKLLMVHRLDMSTSGIMVAAKNLDVYRNLQKQFASRKVKKVYTAILDGTVKRMQGKIELPIRMDFDNRPMQMVDWEHGKMAITYFRVLEIKDNTTRIQFFPVTGRTHQLRLHAAHINGLNLAIKGDELYGKPSDRLYLHATHLDFVNPRTGRNIKLTCKPPF